MKTETFGQYIVKKREELSISQRKLADISGLTNSTISRIELDAVEPDFSTLEKLSNALDIDKNLLISKCGYSDIPEDFVVIARKAGDLDEKQKKEIFNTLNNTIDDFLLKLEDDNCNDEM